jgi:hypothetical protein
MTVRVATELLHFLNYYRPGHRSRTRLLGAFCHVELKTKVVRMVRALAKNTPGLVVTVIAFALLLAACGGNTPAPTSPPTSVHAERGTGTSTAQPGQVVRQQTPTGTEKPVAPEKNPPGDIPDTQAFVKYTSSTGGYELEVPEGWSRTENGPNVNFVDKLDGVQVSVTETGSAPTASAVRSNFAEIAGVTSARAVEVSRVEDVQRPAGPAVFVEYTSNSEPNPVTSKQVRLENNAYLFYRNGKLATLVMWAPLGADNVDQWQHMSESFTWR